MWTWTPNSMWPCYNYNYTLWGITIYRHNGPIRDKKNYFWQFSSLVCVKSLQFDILKKIQYLQFSIFPGSGFTCMQHKKRFRVSKIGIKSQSHKIVGVCGRKSEREGELMKATQIVLFSCFFIYPHVILVLQSWRLVRVSASFITVSTFPTGTILKGFYSAITPYSYLGNTDTRMHG